MRCALRLRRNTKYVFQTTSDGNEVVDGIWETSMFTFAMRIFVLFYTVVRIFNCRSGDSGLNFFKSRLRKRPLYYYIKPKIYRKAMVCMVKLKMFFRFHLARLNGENCLLLPQSRTRLNPKVAFRWLDNDRLFF